MNYKRSSRSKISCSVKVYREILGWERYGVTLWHILISEPREKIQSTDLENRSTHWFDSFRFNHNILRTPNQMMILQYITVMNCFKIDPIGISRTDSDSVNWSYERLRQAYFENQKIIHPDRSIPKLSMKLQLHLYAFYVIINIDHQNLNSSSTGSSNRREIHNI